MSPESHQRRLDHLRLLISKRKGAAREGTTDLTYLRRLNLGAYAVFPVLALVNWRECSGIQAGEHQPFIFVMFGASLVMVLIFIVHLIKTHRAMELFRLHKVENISDIPGSASSNSPSV